MFRKFINWMNENNSQVSWFFIGYFISEGSNSLLRNEFGWAVWSFALVLMNYVSRKPWPRLD